MCPFAASAQRISKAKKVAKGTKLAFYKAMCLGTELPKAKRVTKGTKLACRKAMCLCMGVPKTNEVVEGRSLHVARKCA